MGWLRKDKSPLAHAVPAPVIADEPEWIELDETTLEEPAHEVAHPEGVYEGRLSADGYGGLLADSGPWRGYHVKWVGNGLFEFVQEGELTHNAQHHQRFVDVVRSSPADPHHEFPTEDDAHYDETAPRKTFVRFDPDRLAETITGHTDAYKES